VATALPTALAFYVYRRGSRQGAILLMSLLLAMSEWSLVSAVELATTRPTGRAFWVRAEFAGALALPPPGWPLASSAPVSREMA
jgi:N-terminal 7TM region of histidine kinase